VEEVDEDVEPEDFDSPLVELIVLPFDSVFPELDVDDLFTGVLFVRY